MFKQYLTGSLAASAALVPMVAPAIAHAAPAEAPRRAPDRPSVDPATGNVMITQATCATKTEEGFFFFKGKKVEEAQQAPYTLNACVDVSNPFRPQVGI